MAAPEGATSMTEQNAVASFKPSTNGFRFGNSFSGPDLTVNVPVIGTVDIGDASNGVCGGMVFAVRDFFEASLPIPAATTPPAAGTPLFTYITGRLFDSFNIPEGIIEYLDWMNTPDHDTGIWIAVRHGVAWMTIEVQWPIIKACIDSGHPCPLGLVTVYSLNPADLGHCHVVLAYGYVLDDSGNLTINVGDPNSPDNDGVEMSLNIENPSHTTPISHNINIGFPVRGFFALAYSPHDPSALEPPPPPPPPQHLLRVSVTPYPAPTEKAVAVTVNAMDSVTRATVHGNVLINNATVGRTGVPFVYTFRPVIRIVPALPAAQPVADIPPPVSWPTGRVVAPGYPIAVVTFV
jgi:hypothetical protein